MRVLWLALLLLVLRPVALGAQDPGPEGLQDGLQDGAALVADVLTVSAEGRLVAEGNVQAFYRGTVVSARRVTYDRDADRLAIEGPILLRRPDGTVLAADRADLDARLEDGLLQGARLVLDRRLQLAAARIDRTADGAAGGEGGATTLTQAAITSCQVCPGAPPIWEIRARRVVHDEAAQVLHVEGATFRVRGVPILWLPRARLPDPSNTRETGLLVPSVRTTGQLGVGVKLPLFAELGPSRDVLLTPYLSPLTSTIEARFRQAFLAGDLLVQGAASRDDLRSGDARGFVAAVGDFGLPGDLGLAFEGIAVTDDAYLLDYGVSDLDRLQSTLALTRVGEDSLLVAGVSAFQSLREGEDGGSLVPVVAALTWGRRLDRWGGTLDLEASADGFARSEAGEGDAARDVARAGVAADWRQASALGPGVLVEARARLALDAFRVSDDPAFPGTVARAAPAAAVTLRWPLLRRGTGDLDGGSSDLVEPVASLGWAEAWGGENPVEDARLVELDGGNLYALTRLPGEDVVEDGLRLSTGLSWTRAGPGFAATLALGRVVRAEALDVPQSSGLRGTASDTLLAGRLDLAGGVALNARTLLSGPVASPGVGKTEARLDWSGDRLDATAAYLFLPADPGEDRAETAAEWTVDADLRASPRWSLGVDARYDVGRERPARAGLRVGWRNECVEVDVTVARRYTSTDAAEPSTDFGLSVNLIGFSTRGVTGGGAVAPGACRG